MFQRQIKINSVGLVVVYIRRKPGAPVAKGHGLTVAEATANAIEKLKKIEEKKKLLDK